jgi:hypothetical protein
MYYLNEVPVVRSRFLEEFTTAFSYVTQNSSSNQLSYCVGFEVLTAVVIKSPILWDMSRSLRRFGETYRLHLRCQTRNLRDAGSSFLHAGFLLGLVFDPEDEGGMFLRNFIWFSTDYKVFYISLKIAQLSFHINHLRCFKCVGTKNVWRTA